MNLPPETGKWLHLQRTLKGQQDDARLAQIKNDVLELREFFGLEPASLLDFGCGLGIGTVFMHRQFQNATITAVDGTGPPEPRGGMLGTSDVPWNDLALTRRILEMNDCPAEVLDLADVWAIDDDSIDTVVSMVASGWHWWLTNDMPLFNRVGATKIVVDQRRTGVVNPTGWRITKQMVKNEKRVRVLLER